MSIGHEIYIKRCFDLATRGLGAVSPNPLVGCLIVVQDKVIGEGWHAKYGGAHAEVNAFAAVKPEDLHLIPESTVYVSLEPCCHFGKTPPCSQLLIQNKVKKVVISVVDPNPLVAGNGIRVLQEAGIEVESGILEAEGRQLIRHFLKNIQSKRPHVVLKWARSKDGFLGRMDERTQLSNPLSQRWVHQIRGEMDGILVGTNTAIVDNPRLDNRLFYGKSPRPILIDRHQRTSDNLFIRENPNTIIITRSLQYPIHHQQERVVDNFSVESLPNLLEHLYTLDIGKLLVEGGAKTLQIFLDSGLFDEVIIVESEQRLKAGVPQPIFFASAKKNEKLGSDTWSYY